MEACFRDWIYHHLNEEWHWRQKDAIAFFDTGALRAGSFITARAGQAGVRGTGTLPRHGVKRVNRMLKNTRYTKIKMHDASIQNIIRLVKNRKRIILAIDWTEKDGIHLLCISLVTDAGRAVPVVWDGYREREIPACSSQNKIEEELIAKVIRAVPEEIEIVVLADRGFDRAKLAEFLGEMGKHVFYVIRASADAYITWRGKSILIQKDMIAMGEFKNYGWVKYSDEHQVRLRFCAAYDEGMKEPWLLITNIADAQVETIVSLYGMRMTIEEMFKSMKNEVMGFSLRQVRLKDIARWLVLCFIVSLLLQFLWEITLLCGKRKLEKAGESYSLARHRKVNRIRAKSYSFYYLMLLLYRDATIYARLQQGRLYVEILL